MRFCGMCNSLQLARLIHLCDDVCFQTDYVRDQGQSGCSSIFQFRYEPEAGLSRCPSAGGLDRIKTGSLRVWMVFEPDSAHGKRPTQVGTICKTFIALALVPPAQAALFLIAEVKLMGAVSLGESGPWLSPCSRVTGMRSVQCSVCARKMPPNPWPCWPSGSSPAKTHCCGAAGE